jgi:hypothetical protein
MSYLMEWKDLSKQGSMVKRKTPAISWRYGVGKITDMETAPPCGK